MSPSSLKVQEQALRIAMAEAQIRNLEGLARQAGVSPATLGSLLQGASFRSSTIERIADALHCNPLDLLEGLIQAPEARRSQRPSKA